MEYRRLGSAGVKVSVLSLGSWVTYGNQVDVDAAVESMRIAYEAGVNFFDNAEAYAKGASETLMGTALRKLGWRRGSYLISSKFFWGLHDGPNEINTLNRKYLLEAIDGSLKRLGLDHVDLIFCHRPDPHTSMEEIVRAMNDIVASGRALYWGTSEWAADQIMEAWRIADKRNLYLPQMEQPQYNLFTRSKVEEEFTRLYDTIGLGLTTWSPLASGILTGKYNKGIPKGSRMTLPGYSWLADNITEAKLQAVHALQPIADELGTSLACLAIAWCAANPRVSTVITGASGPNQIKDNLKALEIIPRLTPELMARIAAPLVTTIR